jgi:hypothetical protein
MNLNNFHKNISQKIHERGEKYYENDIYDDYDGDLGCVCQEAAKLIAGMS